MRKKIVVLAVTAVCAGGGAWGQTANTSHVQLWGIVDAAIRHTDNQGPDRKNLTEMVGGGMSESRWGIKVNEELGGGSKAFVELENRFKLDSGTTPSSYPFFQLAYVGLQGPYGRLSMGRQWNVLFDVVSSTYASFPYSPYMDAYKPELGMAAGARTNNALKYTLATPTRSWVGTLQYSFAEGNRARGAENAAVALGSAAGIPLAVPAAAVSPVVNGMVAQLNNSTGVLPSNLAPLATQIGNFTNEVGDSARGAYKTLGGFLRFSHQPWSVGGGFLRTYLPGGSDLDAWTVGGSYRDGKLYVNMGYGLNKVKAASFSGASAEDYLRYTARQLVDRSIVNNMWQGQTNGGFQQGNADKRQMAKIGFGYQFTPQINAGMHYFHAKQSGDASGDFNGKAHMMVAALDYAFSKRTDAYFAVDHTRVSGGEGMEIDRDSHARKRTGITVGLRHRF